jgi:hypothetical protein
MTENEEIENQIYIACIESARLCFYYCPRNWEYTGPASSHTSRVEKLIMQDDDVGEIVLNMPIKHDSDLFKVLNKDVIDDIMLIAKMNCINDILPVPLKDEKLVRYVTDQLKVVAAAWYCFKDIDEGKPTISLMSHGFSKEEAESFTKYAPQYLKE